MNELIGREKEVAELQRIVDSDKSEFVVIYGRRRIGKTFLVRKFFDEQFTFHYVGKHHMKKSEQLASFREVLIRQGASPELPKFGSWGQAFGCLQQFLEKAGQGRKVIFFDEMPWMDSKGSDFVSELEYFWNSWASLRDDIIFIACGSATTWMHDKIEKNRGGLHNRITRKIYLRPFNLHECELYLQKAGFDWDRYQIIQCYMIFGGVPYYLSLLLHQLSLQQNIDNLFFKRGASLSDEFTELYNALYGKADKYIKIVRLLSERKEGLTKKDIMKETGYSGGGLTTILNNLERCDFVISYLQFGSKVKNTIYRLSDFYTRFYFKFVESSKTYDEQYWSHHFNDSGVLAWEGYSFEMVGLLHLDQIKKGLGISGIATESSSWNYVPSEKGNNGFQIDLIIKRVDKIVHLCELKFSENKYLITKEYEKKLSERRRLFMEKTDIARGVVYTFITPAGLSDSSHNKLVHSQITTKELFTE